MTKRKTTEQFIKESKEVHGDVYDYSLVNYIHSKTKVNIICKEHGTFLQTPNMHLQGQRCFYCTRNRKTTEQFIKESKEVHGDLYDYSLVEYVNCFTKVIIICKEHGQFVQDPSNHLEGKGCSSCSGTKKKTSEEFISEVRKIHNNKYDYSKTIYTNTLTKVMIVCKEHGDFEQCPRSHLRGKGCPKCNTSKGEKRIMSVLDSHNIKYKTEQMFDDLVGVGGGQLRFDFGIEDENLLIEYDGKQHYHHVKTWMSEEIFNDLQHHDKMKNEFCDKNGITLLRIKYTDYDKIEEILDRQLL